MENMNNNYKDIINLFVLNLVLHHVGKSWIIETKQHLEYDVDNNNPYWITSGPWYNKSIFKKYVENCFNNLLEMHELTDIMSCVLLMHMKNRINQI